MIVSIAIILGLLVNYFTWWVPFSSALCVFAGIFMIMPSLVDFATKDALKVFEHKRLLWINILTNFVITPLIALGIGLIFFQDIGLQISLILLSLLSWGGLVFAWIQKNKGNIKFWFQLFMINLLIFTLIFFVGTPFVEQIWILQWSWLACDLSGPITCGGLGWSVSPISAIIVLVIIPFLISRIVRWNKKSINIMKKYGKYMSQLGTFVIIGYIFSLEQMHALFQTDIFLLLKIFVATLLFYILLFGYNLWYQRFLPKTSESKSLFWISTSRFITLGLVLSFMYTQYFGATLILIFVSAYFIQIGLSQLISYYVLNKK